MNKAEFIAAIADKTSQTQKDVEKTIAAFWEVVTETLSKNDTVSFIGLGSFGTKERAARTGLNPKTKERLEIPAATVPYFKVGNKLKEAVAKTKK